MGTGGQGGLEAVGAGQGGSKSVMGVGVEAASHPPASGLFVRGQMHPNEPPPTHFGPGFRGRNVCSCPQRVSGNGRPYAYPDPQNEVLSTKLFPSIPTYLLFCRNS